MSISDNIKAIRTQKGIAQAEIARRLDIEPSSYHRLENRGDKMTIEQVDSIAMALGVSRSDLLNWGEEKGTEAVEKHSIRKLQDKIKELTTARDIAQDYVEDLKRKTYRLSIIFYSIINSIGEKAELGEKQLVEDDELLIMYTTIFTDKELMTIFEIMFNDHPLLYSFFKDMLQQDIIDASGRMAKLLLMHNAQKDRSLK
ncbi:helix-turn-helix domain-containing protein [Larkinella sp. C7]|uniref:helix-turn-helix domain-containing protein n=1 Tax=Larkinella sp. C7 TaxID=2576607 RepID=UPI0011113412|nr:helix-turn-helix domain-containing protein [Larkinella sp. C7]